ncbi:hypothetical protein [Montanilutibacter psychrotolerans]|uniref:Sulfotransferase family protein n=1 Tax=Montanilutibacter psychrotolerans TaxID=1327343 RepID=A0A3M8SQX3_9GAMM|nr:hypothetical protein [Lysobacter psychrotolerans]RNF83707.1 hypothetical protein EER27_10030 [Lysobacter psychrotolerans]
MPSSPLHDPAFLPFKLDPVTRRVLWLRVDPRWRREAAFLDERALPADAEGGWLGFDSLLDVPLPRARAADAIFHIGHCGSTLLSRLLDSWDDVQGLREPLPLRTLADAWPLLRQPQSRIAPDQAPRLLRALWAAWSLAPAPRSRCVVKATSSCNALAASVLAMHATSRAVLLDMPLRPYLATLLKSPNSVLDAANAAADRLQVLHDHGVGDDLALHALSLPQQCAMGWLAERLRFDALARGEHGDRVLRVDFEALLADPRAVLTALAEHLSLDPLGVDAAMASPAWGRYSKSQDHGYGRDDRAHDLHLAYERHRADIDAGLAWVSARLQRHPSLLAVAGERQAGEA